MKTPTKRTAHRLAAALAIITALATGSVWAADNFWTGESETDNEWATSGNWNMTGTGNDNRKFLAGKLSEKFKTDYGYTVLFSAERTTPWKIHIWTGTQENPIVFQATDPSYGIKVGAISTSNSPGWGIGQASDGADGCLKLGTGTWDTNTGSGWLVGCAAYTGHLVVCDGATVKSSQDFKIQNGSVTVEGGTVEVNSGKWTYVGDNAASTLNLNGGTFKTKHIDKGTGGATVNFNGGTLEANDAETTANGGLVESGVTVNVDAGGGTIDNGGFDVSIGATISGSGTLTFTGDGTTTLSGAESNLIHVNGGRGFAVDNGGLYSPWEVRVGSGTAGALTVNGGTLEVANNKILRVYSKGVINLNGGTLKMPYTAIQNGAVFNFNGGTLQANKSSADFIVASAKINVKGGTINSGNFAITIKSPLGVSGDAGGLTFTGGNTITLNDAVNYSGKTAVTPGTILAIANSTAKANILKNGLVVAGLPVADQTVVTSTSAFSDADLTSISCSLAPTTTFKFTDETKTSIAVDTPGATINYWTGAADNDLSNDANWSSGTKPTGEAYIICATPETLTKGDTFAPTSITFLEGSAAVTINGDTAFENITEIVSLSSSSHIINVPVHFAGNIQVKQAAMADTGDLAKAHVTFAGGAYAAPGYALENADADADYSRCIFGKYYLASTAGSPWTATIYGATKRICVADGSCLSIPYAGALKELYVGNGAKVDVGDMKPSGTVRPYYQVYGEMVVTNLTESGTGDREFSYNQGTSTPGVYKFNSALNEMNDNWWYVRDQNATSKLVFYIGSGGINFSNKGVCCFGRNASGDLVTIRPWYSDFTIAGRGDSTCVVFASDAEFNTSDENGVGRQITLNAKTRNAYNGRTITVSGKGTLQVNNGNDNTYQPSVVVKDSATLEYAARASFGTGAITLGAGTTFAFVNSGSSLALPSTITFPADGAATLRIGGDRLRSGKHTIATGVESDAADHLIVDPASAALDGRKYTLKVEEDKLMLNIESDGLTVVFW